MSDFVNREAELAAVQRTLDSDRAELLIVFGRRGVGKSELLVRAMEGRGGLYYQATTEVMAQQLTDLAAETREAAGAQALIGRLDTIGDFLGAVTVLAQGRPDQPFPVVIDEFPYLAEADSGVETVFQRWWDESRRIAPNLKLFLAGSQVSWMREHTFAEHGPLQNRRTGQIELLPLSYRHAALLYPRLDPVDRVRAYGIWGGLPGYLRELNSPADLWEAVAHTVLRPEARLAVEPDWLRFTDFRADRLYTSIVRAVAMDAHRPSDIARAVGRAGAAEVILPLNRLIEAGIVVRTVALTTGDGGKARTRYEVADPFLAFWYRFIDPRRGLIRRVRTADAAARIAADIAGEIDDYIARYVFESICREWVWEAAARGALPVDLSPAEVGAWWGGRDERQDEIDVVTLSAQRKGILYGECKWSAAPMDMRDLGGLRVAISAASHDITPIDRPWRALFSRSGFHPALMAEAAQPENRILLVGLDLLYDD